MKSRGLPASSTSVGPLAGAGPMVIESACARTEPSSRTPNLSPKATGRSRICDSLLSAGGAGTATRPVRTRRRRPPARRRRRARRSRPCARGAGGGGEVAMGRSVVMQRRRGRAARRAAGVGGARRVSARDGRSGIDGSEMRRSAAATWPWWRVARSPSDTMPTTWCSASTTGSRRICTSDICCIASCTVCSEVHQRAWPVITSPTCVSPGSPAAVARTVMSRSVIMPTRPLWSHTGSEPTLSSSITCAARCRLSSGRTTCTLRVMKSEIFCMGGLATGGGGDRRSAGVWQIPVPSAPRYAARGAARRQRAQQRHQPALGRRQRLAAALGGRLGPALLQQRRARVVVAQQRAQLQHLGGCTTSGTPPRYCEAGPPPGR